VLRMAQPRGCSGLLMTLYVFFIYCNIPYYWVESRGIMNCYNTFGVLSGQFPNQENEAVGKPPAGSIIDIFHYE